MVSAGISPPESAYDQVKNAEDRSIPADLKARIEVLQEIIWQTSPGELLQVVPIVIDESDSGRRVIGQDTYGKNHDSDHEDPVSRIHNRFTFISPGKPAALLITRSV